MAGREFERLEVEVKQNGYLLKVVYRYPPVEDAKYGTTRADEYVALDGSSLDKLIEKIRTELGHAE